MLTSNGPLPRVAVTLAQAKEPARLRRPLEDSSFAGVGAEQALDRLPQPERSDWQQLWKEVEALRQRAGRPPQEAPGKGP
jgi:hypothetical protein